MRRPAARGTGGERGGRACSWRLLSVNGDGVVWRRPAAGGWRREAIEGARQLGEVGAAALGEEEVAGGVVEQRGGHGAVPFGIERLHRGGADRRGRVEQRAGDTAGAAEHGPRRP